MRQKREELAEIGPLFANFVAEAAEVLLSKASSSCNGSIRSHATTTASRRIVAQADTELTRERRVANLQRKALAERQAIDSRRREAEQEEERLKLLVDSEMRMIETEVAVERARAELEIEDPQVLSEIGDLAPVLSAKDKVRNFVNSSNSDVDVLSVNLDHPSGGSEAAEAVHADGVADRMMQTAHSSGMVPSAARAGERKVIFCMLPVLSVARVDQQPRRRGRQQSKLVLLTGKGLVGKILNYRIGRILMLCCPLTTRINGNTLLWPIRARMSALG